MPRASGQPVRRRRLELRRIGTPGNDSVRCAAGRAVIQAERIQQSIDSRDWAGAQALLQRDAHRVCFGRRSARRDQFAGGPDHPSLFFSEKKTQDWFALDRVVSQFASI